MKEKIAIELININKDFYIFKHQLITIREKILNFFEKNSVQRIEVLKDINLQIFKGECVGIIGRNGSGKSTLLKIMSGVYVPDGNGKVKIHGQHILLNLGLGFAPQMTGYENIYINGSILGLKKSEIQKIERKIIEFSELEDFIYQKVKYYSSGMVQRLAFSIALYVKTDILFLDEVFAVGDAKFVKKATEAIEEHFIGKKTIIMVSHDQEQIEKYCQRVFLLHKGQLIFEGRPKEAYAIYNQLD